MSIAIENLPGDRGEERAIGSAAECHDDAAEATKLVLQRFDLDVDRVVDSSLGHGADASGPAATWPRRNSWAISNSI